MYHCFVDSTLRAKKLNIYAVNILSEMPTVAPGQP
jgi:hypothetical protein